MFKYIYRVIAHPEATSDLHKGPHAKPVTFPNSRNIDGVSVHVISYSYETSVNIHKRQI